MKIYFDGSILFDVIIDESCLLVWKWWEGRYLFILIVEDLSNIIFIILEGDFSICYVSNDDEMLKRILFNGIFVVYLCDRNEDEDVDSDVNREKLSIMVFL